MYIALPTSGLGAFANIIISGFGFSVLDTQLLAMVLGAYIMFCLLSSSYITRKWGQTVLVMIAYAIPWVWYVPFWWFTHTLLLTRKPLWCLHRAIPATVVLMAVENTTLATKAGLLFCYYLALSFWATSTLAISLITRNVGGQTKKTVAVAVNFVFWAAGNAIGKIHNAFYFNDNINPLISIRPPSLPSKRRSSLSYRICCTFGMLCNSISGSWSSPMALDPSKQEKGTLPCGEKGCHW